MQGLEEGAGVNARGLQAERHLLSIAAEVLSIDQAGSKPRRDRGPRSIFPNTEARNAREVLVVKSDNLTSAGNNCLPAFHLAAEDRSSHVGHPVVEADDWKMIPSLGIHALAAEHAQASGEREIVDRDGATLAAGEHLVAKK